ncbi:alpha/beta hydrolase [Faunimonas sp. B44]|uniref:alpha/beta hydrolase n=1 Tax=Faunimonas sp. B44 TaxID=3461493 RepID=UPI004044C4E8
MQDDIRAATKTKGTEHWTESNGQKLFLWEKPAVNGASRGTVLFIHGSSMASQPTFDLQVEGMPEASVMDWFASRGFDTWCFDCRGYGRSYKGDDMLAVISDGADDAKAATDYIMAQGKAGPFMVYGISSGALRAALFAQRNPDRVSRLALDAMVWTGEGSPTLEQRRQKLDQWRGSTRRPLDRAFLLSIFNRDHPGTAEDRFIDPFIEQVLALDDSMPNGTYIDMCANLPVVDPEKISAATVLMRGEYDGIAGMDDLLKFFDRLPNADKEFAVMPGIAHASFTQKNFLLVYQILHAFFTRPEPVYRG